MARDMTLFVDEDGSAYHIYASEANGALHISQLSGDFLKPAGKFIRLFPGRFHEAPAMMKRGGRYFLITSGCTGWTPNAARLSAAGIPSYGVPGILYEADGGGIHGLNEHIRVSSLMKGRDYLYRLVKVYAATP